MPGSPWDYRTAAGLTLAGAAVMAAAFLIPSPGQLAATPINLSAGAVTELTFVTPATSNYQVQLEMDRPQAERLFPCAVNLKRMRATSCQTGGLPLDLDLEITPEQGAGSHSRYNAVDERGGQYGGDSFGVMLDYVGLQGGVRHALKVRANRDGSALSPAHPRLVVKISDGAQEAEMFKRLLWAGLGLVVLLAGALWAAGVALFRRLRRRPSPGQS